MLDFPGKKRKTSESVLWKKALIQQTNKQKRNVTKQKMPPKTSITQKLQNDIGQQKGGDLTQFYEKSPYTSKYAKLTKWQHKQCHKKVRLNRDCGPTQDAQLE